MSKAHFGCIYLITNIQTNKHYFGKCEKKNPISYIESHFASAQDNGDNYNRRLYQSIRKHGVKNFKYEIIGYCKTKKELNQAEKDCIALYQTNMKRYGDLYGYNMTDGGDGGSYKGINKGRVFSEEHKRKLSIQRRLRIISEETKLKTSRSLKGKQNNPWTKESRDKLGVSLLGNTHKKGKKLTEEGCHNISKAMRLSQLGKKRGPYKKRA